MTTNVFANLGLPVLNGAGTAVDVSTLGPRKTIVVNGDYPGCTIEIQGSQVAGGASGYAPVATFNDGDTHRVVQGAFRYLRTFVRNRVAGATFTANVDVGAPEWTNEFASITMPGADGDGASIDVSALGSLWTVNVTGDLAGARVTLQISEDGTAWAALASFNVAGQQTFQVSAQFARVNVQGYTSGFTATCQIGAADDASPAAGGGPSSTCLVYQPGGGLAGPVVFDSWEDLDAALQALRLAAGGGCYRVDVDDSITSPAVIPARVARWDLTDTVLAGAGNGAAVSFADGCGFTGLRTLENGTFTNLNTTTAPIADVVNGDLIVLRRAIIQTVTGGTIAMIAYTVTTDGAVTLAALESSALGGAQTGYLINVSGQHTLTIILDSSSTIPLPGTVRTPSATTTLRLRAPSMLQVPATFANWSGTGGSNPVLLGPMSLLPNPFNTTPANAGVASPGLGQWLRLSAGAGYTQTLPAIATARAAASAQAGPGVFLLITEQDLPAGASMAKFVPDAGDTVDGSTDVRAVPRGGGMLLVSDGISRWSIVAAWGLNRMLLPYVWRQDDVAAGQTDVALSPQPTGSLFAAFQALRAGSVVGLSVRFNENITVSGATFHATINGVNTTLAVTINDGNTQGVATQFAGVDNYVAYDLIGVAITTTGGFAPNTADVEVVVEVEEVP